MSSSHSVLIVLLFVDAVGIGVLRWIDVRKRPTLYVLLGLFLVPALIPGSLVEALNEFGIKPALERGWFAAFDLLVPVLVLGSALWAGLHLRSTRADAAKPPPRKSGLRSDQLPRLTVLTCRNCGAARPSRSPRMICAPLVATAAPRATAQTLPTPREPLPRRGKPSRRAERAVEASV